MKLNDIASIRLNSQQITATKFKTPKEIVGWMGAMQAQDYAMVKWAIGLRLPTSTDKQIETAIDKGEILRTHLLRPTWHFVVAEDIHWMLELTAPHIRSSLKLRHKELELTEKILRKTNAIIEKALGGNKHLTREELMSELTKTKIATDNNRGSHILLTAELAGIICSGKIKDDKQTYALLETRVPKAKILNKDEALAKLAKKYFSSHGPATLQDFTWWSGLSAVDARHALEMIKSDFASEIIGTKIYWLPNSFSIPKKEKNSVYLLPSYDEFIISYKDRSATLDVENHRKSVSENGIFKPTLIINGQVTGLWKRTIKKDKVIIETDLFITNKSSKKLIKKAAESFGNFLEKKVEVI